MGWRTVIQHVSKHTRSPSTAWGKLFGTFVVNLWQAHHTATLLPPAGAAASPHRAAQTRAVPGTRRGARGAARRHRQPSTARACQRVISCCANTPTPSFGFSLCLKIIVASNSIPCYGEQANSVCMIEIWGIQNVPSRYCFYCITILLITMYKMPNLTSTTYYALHTAHALSSICWGTLLAGITDPGFASVV